MTNNLLATPNGRRLLRLTLAQADRTAAAAQEREQSNQDTQTATQANATQANVGTLAGAAPIPPPLGPSRELLLNYHIRRSAEEILSNRLMD